MTEVRELKQEIAGLKVQVRYWQENHERIEDKAQELSKQDDGWGEVMEWAKQADAERDPLSDDAFEQVWKELFPICDTQKELALMLWQECARRALLMDSIGKFYSEEKKATEDIDWITDLDADNKRLLGLVKSLEAIATLASTAEWLDQKYVWQEIRKARAALEGKE
jgi:hypothetical protein